MRQLPRFGTAALFAWAALAAQAAPNLPPTNFEIVTLSNRADLISGGDALVEVRVPKTVPLHQVKVLLNGRDITGAFVTNGAARTMRGVVTGLVQGENDLIADSNGQGRGRPRARLTITNHPIGGPVLLGSQTQPWICATPAAVPASGNTPASNASGLTTFATDAQCNIATEYLLFYRTTNPLAPAPCRMRTRFRRRRRPITASSGIRPGLRRPIWRRPRRRRV